MPREDLVETKVQGTKKRRGEAGFGRPGYRLAEGSNLWVMKDGSLRRFEHSEVSPMTIYLHPDRLQAILDARKKKKK